MYQRPSSETVMFVDSFVYVFDFMGLRLNHGYQIHLKSLFNIKPNNMDAVFNSNTRKTFILYDDNYYREVTECTFTVKS